jgi:hypothetical protein
MAITTFWTDQLKIYTDEQTAAQGDLAAAQALQKTASTQLATDLRALDQATGGIAAMRAQLAVTTVPAEAQALITQITAKIIEQRGLQSAVLDDQEALAAATVSANAAKTTLSRATARAASVQATITQVTADDARRTALTLAVAAPPLATLKTDAGTFHTSQTVTDATTQRDSNFPLAIRNIAGLRHDTRTKRVASLQAALDTAQAALGTELATDAGLQGTVTQKQIAFQRAQGALSLYVATAANRFAKAQAVMNMLAAIHANSAVPDVLTAAEKAQVQAPALAGPGAAAEPAAANIDADLNAVYTAQDTLDALILSTIQTDVDHLASDTANQRTAIATATTAYKNAIASFAAAASPNKADLDQWEAVIPDSAWKVLLDFEEADAALTELSTVDPAALALAMGSAENDYTTALTAAEVARRKADAIGDAIGLCQERLAAAQAALANRLPSAIRGDSY